MTNLAPCAGFPVALRHPVQDDGVHREHAREGAPLRRHVGDGEPVVDGQLRRRPRELHRVVRGPRTTASRGGGFIHKEKRKDTTIDKTVTDKSKMDFAISKRGKERLHLDLSEETR